MNNWKKDYLNHIEQSIKIIDKLKSNWIFLGESDFIKDNNSDLIEMEMTAKMQLKDMLITNQLEKLSVKMHLHKVDFLNDTKEI